MRSILISRSVAIETEPPPYFLADVPLAGGTRLTDADKKARSRLMHERASLV